ncbi:hypothetical protein LCGC14_1882810 [marine sediment metagenome]|uniref:Uncharacterized protein n=1 Tax=marine sediment metagenome TaxID=412755 RepID=A0A0F9J047_9ZZZZ
MTDFNDFWQLARGCRGRLNSGGRPNAERAWDKAIKTKVPPAVIVAGWLGYQSAMDDTDTDFTYRLMASTFLNQYIWENYQDERAAKEYLARPELRVVTG